MVKPPDQYATFTKNDSECFNIMVDPVPSAKISEETGLYEACQEVKKLHLFPPDLTQVGKHANFTCETLDNMAVSYTSCIQSLSSGGFLLDSSWLGLANWCNQFRTVSSSSTLEIFI